MNVLPREKQTQAIAALVEGCSIRSTERLLDVHRDTIMRLGVQVGEGCRRLLDALIRNVNVSFIELDEQWAFIGKKQAHRRPDDAPELGDVWLFLALDATSKAVLSHVVVKRTAENTYLLAEDLRARVLNRPQITADGFAPYPGAIGLAFGRHDVDFAQLVKVYQGDSGNDAAHRYSPGSIREIEKTAVFGHPDESRISTSYVERFNLTTRMAMRRFTRLTNGFSKKEKNHRAAVALHIAHYNLCRVHEAHRVTPAMQLGVTDHIWTIEELIEGALAAPAAPPIAPAPKPAPVPAGEKPRLFVIRGGRR